MQRTWIALGSLTGLTAVAMAAFAAHGIPDATAQRIVASGVQMQGWHALALVATGLWVPQGGVSWGILAPTGGFLLMGGWLLLAASAIRAR
jgi:uncharacterized membrane protein YgdD (TMEM256/DUF423 family)